jgi:exopolyphosphatase/guanosine-5'-triphosphate,3'-diphosphate pyrophosphatase
MERMPRYAAIDIGSNSIRMEAAEVLPGQASRILASDREVTRLGESVFRSGSVSEEAIATTCAVLERMAGLYRRLEVVGVRAVATSAVRDTRNQERFLERASEAAGTEVEIISGREEARLIHLGIENLWPHPGKRVLAIDIGGGSAEIIAAEDGRMTEAFSRPLGAVRLRELFLNTDPPSQVALRHMCEFIDEKLKPAVARLANQRWDRVIATSATASAVVSMIARVPRSRRDSIDRQRITGAQIRQLWRKLATLDLAARRRITGIGPRRAEIIAPGVAVLERFTAAFRSPSLYYSRAGVRDGIIADLAARGVGREYSSLSREQRREVEQMARRFAIAPEQGRRVATLADTLFHALQPLHRLPPYYGKLLEAAAHLINIGHFISHSSHHKHSWYIVANADLSGFTARERMAIAQLCRYHRKSMPTAMHEPWQALPAEDKRSLLLLIPILRLADGLDPAREGPLPSVSCRLTGDGVELQVDAASAVDLDQWAAARTGDAFRQVYGKPLAVVKARR